MNILHLEASPGWGGQEIRTLRESLGMIQRGHKVVLVVEKGGGLVSHARQAGLTVYELSFAKKQWFFSFWKLLRIIKKEKIQLVNTHSSLDAWLGGFVARFLGCKIIRTRHLSTPIKKGYNSIFLYRKLADFVITTCQAIVPVIIEQSGRSLETTRSIPTGVDPTTFVAHPKEIEKFKETYTLGSEDFLVGTACFMRSWKGIEEFLHAANKLRNEPHLKWVIIGGGFADRYHRLAKTLDLDKQVIFTGHLENPFPAIAAVDLFALLSTGHEGVSQASLQAAYFEKPIIGTPTGGIPEVSIEGETGIRVPCYDPQAVADAVLLLRKDPQLRKSLGANAKKLVQERFTVEHMLNETEEIYKKIAVC